MLGIYQQILQGERIPADDSREQIELLLSGLAVKYNGYLQVKNKIYAEVFNLEWVEQQLSMLRPYSQSLDAWIVSERQDESRLLRGQALRDAQEWSQGKRLSDLDYQFLAASVESDRIAVQQSLEAARIKAVEAQLVQEKRNAQLQKRFSIAIGTALLITLGLGLTTFWQYRQAKISEIKALASSSEGNFESNRQIEAIIDAIQAKQELQKLNNADTALQAQVQNVLQRTIYGIKEYNRWSVGTGIQDIAISPDGTQIASAGKDGRIKLWQQDGKFIKEISADGKSPAHTAPASAVSFSPDGKLLLSAASDRTIKLWSIDGSSLKIINGNQTEIKEVKFSPNGQLFASVGEDQTVKLWRSDGTLIATLFGKGLTFAFSPDSKLIATATIGKPIHLWRTDGRLVRVFPTLASTVHKLAFSPDGKKIAHGAMKSVGLWQIDGKKLQTYTIQNAGIWAIAFSPNGQLLATAGQDNTIRILLPFEEIGKREQQKRIDELRPFPKGDRRDLEGFPPPPIPRGDRQDQTKPNFPPNKETLFPNSQKPLISPSSLAGKGAGGLGFPLTSPKNSQQNKPNDPGQAGLLFTTLVGHKGNVNGIAFSPQGNLLTSASEDGTIRVWKLDNPLINSLIADTGGVLHVAVSPDGDRIISVGLKGVINLWQRNRSGEFNLRPNRSLIAHDLPIYDAAFSPDGRLFATASRDGTVIFWNQEHPPMRRGKDRRRDSDLDRHPRHKIPEFMPEKESWLESPEFRNGDSPRPPIPASPRPPQNARLQTLDVNPKMGSGDRAHVNSIAFSPDGQWFVTASSDNLVKLWRRDRAGLIPDKKPTIILVGHQASVKAVEFSPDSQFIVSGGLDKPIKIWDTNGKLVKAIAAHEAPINSIAFSPKDNIFASASEDNTVKLGRTDGNLIATLQGHQAAVLNVNFSADGNYIVSSSIDGTIKIWNSKGSLVKTLKRHNSAVRSAAFIQDGKMLISAGDDQALLLWKLDNILQLDELNYACDWVRDYLQIAAEKEGNYRVCKD